MRRSHAGYSAVHRSEEDQPACLEENIQNLKISGREYSLSRMNMSGAASIGLDLGAGKCCVASVRAGAVTVLPNAHGDKTTPSFVAFTDSRSLVGSDARDQAALNATNTVYGVKTILGRSFRDPVVQNYASYSPVKVVDDGGKPVMDVEYRGGSLRVAPELVAAMQLLKMRQEAEVQIGDIEGVVVAVPASYCNRQREALVAACQIAGLPLLDLISETTATALAYWHNRAPSVAQQTILVFDMGANKVDVSVVKVGQDEISVLAVCGFAASSGSHVDQALMKYVDDKFYDTHGVRLLDNPRATMRLKMACEELKKKLTLLDAHKIQQDSILRDLCLDLKVSRRELDTLCCQTFTQEMNAVLKTVMRNAKLNKDQIDEVVVVGGSSRVPFVEAALKKYFDGKSLNRTVNADECAAIGAAIMANNLIKEDRSSSVVINELIQDPTSCNVEIQIKLHKYLPLKPNLTIICETSGTCGDLIEERIRWSYALDSFGIFKIEKQFIKPFNEEKTKLVEYLKPYQIQDMVDQLNSLERIRKDVIDAEKAVNDLEELCYSLREQFGSFGESEKNRDFLEYVAEVLEWIDENEISSLTECEKRRKKLDALSQELSEPISDDDAALEHQHESHSFLPNHNDHSTEFVDSSNGDSLDVSQQAHRDCEDGPGGSDDDGTGPQVDEDLDGDQNSGEVSHVREVVPESDEENTQNNDAITNESNHKSSLEAQSTEKLTNRLLDFEFLRKMDEIEKRQKCLENSQFLYVIIAVKGHF
ncbi:hypothetical protein HAZT_HAZT004045, partial [Hyalella azteca]